MPNETLKTLTMPIKSGGTATPKTYDIPQGDVKQTELDSLLTDYAKKEGTYEDLVAGSANQLIPSAMETERVPYNFRTAGGSLDIGDREFDKIVGLSLPWNQLAGSSMRPAHIKEGITYTPNSDGSFTLNGTADTTDWWGVTPINTPSIVGHKYILWDANHNGVQGQYGLCYGNSGVIAYGNKVAIISSVSTAYMLGYSHINGAVIDNVTFKPVLIDLTQMFGSTIADYIYSLETATAGAGVAWFKKFFPKQYYAYNSGEIESVKVSSHDMVGFNQWDEEWELGSYNITTGVKETNNQRIRSKNFIPILPNTVYYHTDPTGAGDIRFCYYDADKNFIRAGSWVLAGTFTTDANCHYITFFCGAAYGTTYKNDIVINLHWDGARDGEYEPYKKNSYALDPIELRGILKLDSNNEPYADGDTYEADGTVTRRWNVLSFDGSETFGVVSENDSAKRFSFYKVIPKGVEQDASTVRFSKGIGTWYCADTSTGSTNPILDIRSSYIYINVPKTIFDGTPEQFATFMAGQGFIYKLATPTTESADPFTDPQTVDNWGTEQYVDKAYTDGDRDVEIPVGHETKYPMNLRDKLETAPNAPTSDGDYIVQSASGQLFYVALGSTTTIQNIIARLEALENE